MRGYKKKRSYDTIGCVVRNEDESEQYKYFMDFTDLPWVIRNMIKCVVGIDKVQFTETMARRGSIYVIRAVCKETDAVVEMTVSPTTSNGTLVDCTTIMEPTITIGGKSASAPQSVVEAYIRSRFILERERDVAYIATNSKSSHQRCITSVVHEG